MIITIPQEFVNSVAGSGRPVMQALCEALRCYDPPGWALSFKQERSTAMDRDMEANAPMVELLAQRFPPREIRNKVHYIVNCKHERIRLVAAVQALASNGFVVEALELDGIVVTTDNSPEEAAAVLEILGPLWAHKPYRSKEVLLQAFKDKHPELYWSKQDKGWYPKAVSHLKLCARMRAGQTPAILLAKALPECVSSETRSMVRDEWLCAGGSRDAVNYWRYDAKQRGGLWRLVPGAMAFPDLENVVLDFVTQLLNLPSVDDLPAKWTDGKAASNVVRRLPSALYNVAFQDRMNNYHTYNKLQFSCGAVMLQKTHELVKGRGEFHIARHTGYDYPAEELAKVEQELTGLGVDVAAVLKEVLDYENSLGGLMPYVKLPASTVEKLKRLYDAPCMELLRIIHNIFEDWTMTVFRGIKLLSGALFGEPLCRFVVDSGASGSNGKTVLMRIMEVLMGTYCDQAKETMLTKPPPAPGAAAPDVLAMRGLRALATPEFETTQKMRSGWLKAFADSATKWKARDLYASQEITFRMACVFFVSVNDRLKFSVIDGGVFRRALCIPYDFTFTDNVTQPHHRQSLPEGDLKDDDWLMERMPALLHVMVQAHDVFFNKGKGLGRVPQRIIDATMELMTDEGAKDFQEWVMDHYLVQASPEGAVPRATFLTAARNASALADVPAGKQRDDIINAVVMYVNTKSGRDKTKMKAGGGFVHEKPK